MSWHTQAGVCDRCHIYSNRLVPAFGKYICHVCKQTRPRKGTGNSGLRDVPNLELFISDELLLERVSKSHGMFGHLFFSHYPGSKGIPGRSLCYLIHHKGQIAGIIGANSPPKGYAIFVKYFNVDETLFVNNNVFRIIRSDTNLATRILRLFRERVRIDYRAKYGQKLVGICTFVEPPRTGNIYRADNWDYLGVTQGLRMHRSHDTWEKEFTLGEKKHIFGYRYRGARLNRRAGCQQQGVVQSHGSAPSLSSSEPRDG